MRIRETQHRGILEAAEIVFDRNGPAVVGHTNMESGKLVTEGDEIYYEVRGQGLPLLMISSGLVTRESTPLLRIFWQTNSG